MVGKLFAVIVAMGVVLLGAPAHGQPPPPFPAADAAAAVAAARPDLVRWERWEVARHVREWNTHPERWESVVRDYLA